MMKVGNSESSLGLECSRSDRRQLGGLLLAIGVCVTFQPLDGIALLVNVKQDASKSDFDTLWLICCGIIQVVFGTLAMVVGYLALVHDYSNRRLTGTLILVTQLSWIPFLTGIIHVGIASSPPYVIETQGSTSDGVRLLQEYVVNPFIPEIYSPNKNDVLFLGTMGILGLSSYGVGFFGSLSFLEFALYTFDVGKPTKRVAKYYRGRLLFYSFVMLIAGMSQILLGAYILFEFGGGRLSPSIGVAIYRVSFPEISVAMGSIQMIVGYYGVGNYLKLFPVGPNDNTFQFLALVGWLLQFIFQYIVQISCSEGKENTGTLSSLALYGFAINVFLPYLDYKMRTSHIESNENLYDNFDGISERDDEVGSQKSTTLPISDERASPAENVKSLEIRSGLEDRLGVDGEDSGGTGSCRQEERRDNSEAETPELDFKANEIRTKRPISGFFSRIFTPSRSQTLKQEDQIQTLYYQQVDEFESVDCVPHQILNTSLDRSGTSDVIPGIKPQNHGTHVDPVTTLTECTIKPTIEAEDMTEISGEPKPEINVEETLENHGNRDVLLNDTVDHFAEHGIIVEEYIEYPNDLSQQKIFEQKIWEEAEYNDNVDDEDTPPRSNESFITDMEDTWGNQARQQAFLSPIEEEDFRRILVYEKVEKGAEEQKSNSSREPDIAEGRIDKEARVKNKEPLSRNATDLSGSMMDSSISDSYYDYDSDEEFEISEATPDDDTAQLNAKIDKLKGELLSDINLESYLNKIL